VNQKTVGIRIEGTAQGYVAAAGQAEAATQRLSQQQQLQQVMQQRATASTGQYQQAMRQLPMQITDVTTSLASGMPVWLVAIQQGGQIRDSFGGTTEAGKALLSMLSLKRVALGGVTVALGATALAAIQGRREWDEYTAAILRSGNAAGTTNGQLADIARRNASGGATQGQNAEALAALVGTGQVSGANLESAMRTAVALQRDLGIETSKTVQAFASLGRDPLAAVAKLNEQYNFLSMSTYEQIKQLVSQKRDTEAASIAMSEYARVMEERAKQMAGSLGWLERGWNGLGDAAAKAWDKMLNVGRVKTNQEKLADAQAQLRDSPYMTALDPNDPSAVDQEAQRQSELRQRVADLQEAVREEARFADRAAETARMTRDRISADQAAARAPKKNPQKDTDRLGEFITDQLNAQQRRDDAVAERERQAQERRVQQAMSAMQQLRDANDLEAAYAIRSAEARGKAVIDIEERQMRSRIDMTVLKVEQWQQLEDEFARWRVARERQLTEDLKPEWRRMVDSWADSTALMQRVFDESVTGSLRLGEDAFVSFVRTGKLSIKELTDYLIEQSIRLAFRNLVGQGFGFVFGGGGSAEGFPGNPLYSDGGRATGGPTRRGRRYLVGENGPELLEMGDEGGWITSNERIRAALGGGGGGGGVVAVTLNNQSGTALQVGGATMGEDGRLEVLLLAVDEFMADRVTSGIGAFSSAMGSTFGLRRSFGSR
jgi:phage-related minor tail protein